MRIFISFANEQSQVAESIYRKLLAAKYEVFFASDDIRASDEYDERIRREVARADKVIFLASRESLTAGRFTLTELRMFSEKWPDPTGRVMTVMLDDLPQDSLPPYLGAVASTFKAKGNIPSEVVATVVRRWPVSNKRWGVWGVIAASLLVTGIVVAYQMNDVECGDGVSNSPEQCDDGNRQAGDGCSSECVKEFCGDGVIQLAMNEQCDSGPANGGELCSKQCTTVPFVPTMGSCIDIPVSGKKEDVIQCPSERPFAAGMEGGKGHSSAYADDHKIKCCAMSLRNGDSLTPSESCTFGPKIGQPDTWAPGNDYVVVGMSGGDGHRTGNNEGHLIKYCQLPPGVSVTEECENLQSKMAADNAGAESCQPGFALVSVTEFQWHGDPAAGEDLNWAHSANCCKLKQD